MTFKICILDLFNTFGGKKENGSKYNLPDNENILKILGNALNPTTFNTGRVKNVRNYRK